MTIAMRPNPFDLRRLLAPVGVEQFFASYWQQRMLTVDLAAGDFQNILDEVGPLDIARLAGLARSGVQAWIANDYVAHSVVQADAGNAAKFLEIGATLYFFDVPMECLTHGLADFLGAPRDMVHASFFLTPAGGGAAPHFDANETFTVQLTGHKSWFVSEAPMVDSPPEGYTLGRLAPPSMEELLEAARKGLELKADLRPGTLLYVPRGAVHRTEGGAASWSFNLSYDRTMWLDLLRTGLLRRLGGSARWRGTVAGVGPGCDPGVRAANILPALAAELRDLLADPAEMEQLCRSFFDAPNV